MKATFKKYTLEFISPGGTSRGVLHTKDSWFLFLHHEEKPEIQGVGECSLIPKLSIDDRPDFEDKLNALVADVDHHEIWLQSRLKEFPSIRFGLEMALLDLEQGGQRCLFPSDFTERKAQIPINGLIWMGDFESMKQQISEKIDAGFRCVKLKIGAIDFQQELKLLEMIRKTFHADDLEIRVDANGAFYPQQALEKLQNLSNYDIHSIEQPIKQGQWDKMSDLCRVSPIPIALDEELIGLDAEQIDHMLDIINPQYVILKPSLLGGFANSEHIIKAARKRGVGWWVTSALESNIGLNAIAQWTYGLGNTLPQGLGTGQVYSNNIPSPLKLDQANLYYDSDFPWNLNVLDDVR